IKTRNGYAAGLAYDIDMSHSRDILGTIAGADTVFAILREGVTHEEATKFFSRFVPIEQNQ
ncbi:MAG: arginine repressor, partial [Sodaliphilus pleomorphus]|nr:arginine repressor [Sodaliphilus pleomorphus]